MGDAFAHLAILPALPLLMYATHLSQSYISGQAESFARIGVAVFFGLIAFVFFLFRFIQIIRKMWKLRLGYEAELAMGQELDQLMRKGAVVFHDVAAENFNIDHVVVARNGVFAVETKGRSKPSRGLGKDDAKVIYDGKVLKFPNCVESKSIEQAQRQAQWLARWLSSAVGEKVAVKPVLALPGWFVDRQGRSDVLVISGREAYALMKAGDGQLADGLLQRIEHQLEQKCRDVKPHNSRERLRSP